MTVRLESRPRPDERALAAGTTVRFAMLLVMLLAASGSMMLPVISGLRSSDSLGCELAAGMDPYHSGDAASLVAGLGQFIPYRACLAKYAPPPSWWEIAGWPLVLSAAAGALFFALPVWKTRRRRLIPLELLDQGADLEGILAELAATAGLAQVPQTVVDPAAHASTGSVVFGRNRRPKVCLHGGLLARRRSDPERFRAVLLHEFAHIANGDITVTYVTVALWRVFLALVLVPYLVWEATQIQGDLSSWLWPSNAPNLTRGLLLPFVTVTLVYLARSDVLRSREMYADLAAVRWGAALHGWDVTAPAPARGALRRALASFQELWRTHPRWELRQDALADPAALFDVMALPLFLTGVTAMLINYHLLECLSPYYLVSAWLVQAITLAPAVLVTGVAGTALWRAVTYAVLTSGRVPSGLRSGLWLGAGMAAGDLLTGFGSGSEWLPARPQLLLLFVLAGAAVTWWAAQCAYLWARTWRGQTLRPVLVLSLLSACLVLSSWFAWWDMPGAEYADGVSYSATAASRQALLRLFPGSPTTHPVMLSGIVTALPLLESLSLWPLIPAAVVALWVGPLMAWTMGAPTGAPRWMNRALRDAGDNALPPGERPPPLRRVLLPGLAGGMLGCTAVAGVQAYVHTSRPSAQQPGSLPTLIYLTWVLIALVAATVAAATVAGASLNNYRLLGTLIAAETAAVLGLAGTFLLLSSDGCLGPLNTLETRCAWRPAWNLPQGVFPILLNALLGLAALTAFPVAAAVSAPRRAKPFTAPSSVTERLAQAQSNRRAHYLGTAVLCAAALGIATADMATQAQKQTRLVTTADAQRSTQQWMGVSTLPVSADTRAMQVHAWYRLGGHYLFNHATSDLRQLASVLSTAMDTRNPGYLSHLRPVCADLARIAQWEQGYYFRIPDPQAQADWEEFGTQAKQGSQNCEHDLNQHNRAPSANALREFVAAARGLTAATNQVNKVLRDADYKGF